MAIVVIGAVSCDGVSRAEDQCDACSVAGGGVPRDEMIGTLNKKAGAKVVVGRIPCDDATRSINVEAMPPRPRPKLLLMDVFPERVQLMIVSEQALVQATPPPLPPNGVHTAEFHENVQPVI